VRKLKRILVVIFLLVVAFIVYVEVVNRNTKHMTFKQKALKAVYPAWMWFTRLTNKNRRTLSSAVEPPVALYTISIHLNNGDSISLEKYRGRKILFVNTASNCGYTNQYEELEKVFKEYGNKIVVLGFPANDFKEQEKGTDEEIAQFCKQNFGVSFPLAKKSVVIKSPVQNIVYQWLTDPGKNGWNSKQPSWNFSKYIVNEKGMLTHYFDPSISPTSSEVIAAINE
jgi:glutathione peroxidase